MITVSIWRKTLVRLDACSEGLALYDAIAAMQPATDARRGKRVRCYFTPLHSVWLAAAYPGFSSWLIERGLIPQISLVGANLARANLARAYLARANLARANLTRANLGGAYLDGANLDGANLDGAYLGGANLTRAYLVGANRFHYDSPIPGWRRNANGCLERDLDAKETPR